MRENERIKKESSYLAILVVAHLDRFADACLHVAHDDGTDEGRPAGDDGVSHEPTVRVPSFDPLALKVDWKVLPPDLMYRILNLPYQTEQLVNSLAGKWQPDDQPDYTDFFWARQYGFAVLGLEVSDLARQLRLHAGLPIGIPREDGWNRDDSLREQRDRINKMINAAETRRAVRQRDELI